MQILACDVSAWPVTSRQDRSSVIGRWIFQRRIPTLYLIQWPCLLHLRAATLPFAISCCGSVWQPPLAASRPRGIAVPAPNPTHLGPGHAVSSSSTASHVLRVYVQSYLLIRALIVCTDLPPRLLDLPSR